jgi:predicted transcriptional regulator
LTSPAWATGIVFLARREKEPLDLETRREIYECVEAYPGLHLSEIARRVDMETNHAKYHLEVLERHELVASEKEEGYWRFFPREESELGPKEVLSPEEKEIVSLLRKEVPLHTTLVLLDEGQAQAGELAEAVGVAASTMSYHTSQMQEVGLVEADKQGRSRIYRVRDPERVAELLIRFEPPDELVQGFLDAWDELEFP